MMSLLMPCRFPELMFNLREHNAAPNLNYFSAFFVQTFCPITVKKIDYASDRKR
jgi:hypothetical protein